MAQWVEAEAPVWPWSEPNFWWGVPGPPAGPLLFVCSVGCQCEGGRVPVVSIVLELERQGGAGLWEGLKSPDNSGHLLWNCFHFLFSLV